jgi:hypothetical protein
MIKITFSHIQKRWSINHIRSVVVSYRTLRTSHLRFLNLKNGLNDAKSSIFLSFKLRVHLENGSGSVLRILQPWIQEKKSVWHTYLVKEDIFPIDSFGGVFLKYAWKWNKTGKNLLVRASEEFFLLQKILLDEKFERRQKSFETQNVADPAHFRLLGSGWKKFRSGIRNKRPGSYFRELGLIFWFKST